MTTTTETRRLVETPLEKIVDNPWQPRMSLDPEHIAELAANIEQLGLQQPPVVRPAGDEYQLAFGHYRVAALRHLGRIVEQLFVADLSDGQMALIALAENAKRKDVTPIENYRAWSRVLEIEGMTIEKLADSLGLDRSTVSNNLRLLRLPRLVLDHVDAGELSAHGAREFLCLRGDDGHFHEDLAKGAFHAAQTRVSSAEKRAPGVELLRSEIGEQVRHQPVSMFRPLFKGYGHGADPKFDVEAFKAKYGDRVHVIPWGNKSIEFTCAVSAWLREQKQAEAAPPAKGSGKGASKPEASDSRSKDFGKTLKQDPVFKASDLPVKFEKDGSVSWETDLNDDVAEQLGTRAKPEQLKASDFRVWLDERRLQWDDDPDYHLTQGHRRRIPSYFPDLAECRNSCTIGATWARFKPTRPLYLWCLNQPHFEEKVAKGRAGIETKVQRKLSSIDETDASMLELIAREGGMAGSDAYRRLLAGILLSRATFEAVRPDGIDSYEELNELSVWSTNVVRIFQMLGHKDGPKEKARGGGIATNTETLKALSSEELQELVARLLLNQARNTRELQTLLVSLQPAEEAPPEHLRRKRTPAAAAAP